MAPLLTDGRLGGLGENLAYRKIAFGRARIVVLLGTDIGSGADTDPGTELACRGERLRIYSYVISSLCTIFARQK
jgi:hypothetical protein